jgi:hypothetical protein
MTTPAKTVGISSDQSRYSILSETFTFPLPSVEKSWRQSIIDAIFLNETIPFEEAAKFDIANAEARPGVVR